MTIRRLKSACAALALAASAGAAGAQDKAAPSILFATRTFDTVALHAPPPWSNATEPEAIQAQSETKRQEAAAPGGGEVLLLEWIPAGEPFDNWTELYALMAETGKDASVEAYRNGIIQRILGACTGASYQLIQEAPDQQVFLTICPAYADNPMLGEVAAFNILKSGTTLVRNYYHKRGPAFSPTDITTMPLSQPQMQAVFELLSRFDLKAEE